MNIMTIQDHAGSKYLRLICSALNNSLFITVDVYSVLVAFNVTCPARAHAIKKLLCAGLRNKGSELQDLEECLVAVSRAIEIQRQRDTNQSSTNERKTS